MISIDKIKQASSELREWANSPTMSDNNPTNPEATVQDSTATLEIEGDGPRPVDYYAQAQKKMREEGKKSRPHGSSSAVMAVVREAIEGGDGREGLAHAYRRIKGYSDFGERGELYRQQYMEEQFLPVVETVVNFTSPDELLNSPRALAELDKYVMGLGSGSGYTEGYVRAAYGNMLGQTSIGSDPTVKQAVRDLYNLSANDQIRAAYGLAQKVKAQIDNGEHIADEEDYEIIARVAAFK